MEAICSSAKIAYCRPIRARLCLCNNTYISKTTKWISYKRLDYNTKTDHIQYVQLSFCCSGSRQTQLCSHIWQHVQLLTFRGFDTTKENCCLMTFLFHISPDVGRTSCDEPPTSRGLQVMFWRQCSRLYWGWMKHYSTTSTECNTVRVTRNLRCRDPQLIPIGFDCLSVSLQLKNRWWWINISL